MSSSLVFGDIFVHEGLEYVFLAATSDQIYVAKILDINLSKRVKTLYEASIRKNKEVKLRNLLYCFVVLTTEEVKGRMASLSKTDGYRFEKEIRKVNLSLNEKDFSALKDEILSSRGTPIVLKELISQLG